MAASKRLADRQAARRAADQATIRKLRAQVKKLKQRVRFLADELESQVETLDRLEAMEERGELVL